MSDNYAVTVRQVDFGREVEIIVIDKRNRDKQFRLRVAEIHLDDVEEMLQAILDRLAKSREEKDTPMVERLQEFFEAGFIEARGADED